MMKSFDLAVEMRRLNVEKLRVANLVDEMKQLNMERKRVCDVKEIVPTSSEELRRLKVKDRCGYENVLKKRKVWKKNYLKELKKITVAESNKIQYFKRKRVGLCVVCGDDAEGYRLCVKHREIDENYRRKYREKKNMKI